MEKMIAYCGLDCAGCDAYKATITNDQALKQKTAEEWGKMNNVHITAEMIDCNSCKTEGVKIPYCARCEIRNCASEKGVLHCGACGDFMSCKTINDFIAQAPQVKQNLINA